MHALNARVVKKNLDPQGISSLAYKPRVQSDTLVWVPAVMRDVFWLLRSVFARAGMELFYHFVSFIFR
jgi:hypothetical protein